VPAAAFLGCRFDTGFLPDPASWPEEPGTKRYQKGEAKPPQSDTQRIKKAFWVLFGQLPESKGGK